MAWGVKLLDLRRCKLVKQQAGFEMGKDEVKGEEKGEEDKWGRNHLRYGATDSGEWKDQQPQDQLEGKSDTQQLEL